MNTAGDTVLIQPIIRWHNIFESSCDATKPAKELERELKDQKDTIEDLTKGFQYKGKVFSRSPALLCVCFITTDVRTIH